MTTWLDHSIYTQGTVFDKYSKKLFQYGYGIQRIKADMYDQILMCVCREWYSIVRFLRNKKIFLLKDILGLD